MPEEAQTAFQIQRRPLPTFKQWLEEYAPGSRASGYEPFVDLARRTMLQSLDHLTPTQQSFGRIFIGAMIASVELCHIEEKQHDRPKDEIAVNLSRAFGTVVMYAMASVCQEGTPYRSIAKALAEEFRAATKIAADTLVEADNRIGEP
jgi:hypothetical protein